MIIKNRFFPRCEALEDRLALDGAAASTNSIPNEGNFPFVDPEDKEIVAKAFKALSLELHNICLESNSDCLFCSRLRVFW